VEAFVGRDSSFTIKPTILKINGSPKKRIDTLSALYYLHDIDVNNVGAIDVFAVLQAKNKKNTLQLASHKAPPPG